MIKIVFEKTRTTINIAFGLGVLLFFGLITGFFNGIITQIPDYSGWYGDVAFTALIVGAPIISASIGMLQGLRSEDKNKAMLTGILTGSIGYFMFYLGTFVMFAFTSDEAVDYYSQTISGFWSIFALLTIASAMVCTFSALSSYMAFQELEED